jgi:hypothetical protein
MYTRNHHKRTVQLGGEAPNGKVPLPLMTKGEIFIRCRGQRHGSKGNKYLSDAEDKGMVPGGANLSDVEERGMVLGGA